MTLLVSVAKHLSRNSLREEELIWATVWRCVVHGARKKWQQERVAAGHIALVCIQEADTHRKCSGVLLPTQLSSASFLKRSSTHYLKVSSLLKQCGQLWTKGQTEAYAGHFNPDYNSPHQWHHLGLKCFLRKDCELYVPFDCRRALWVVSPFFSLLCSFQKLYLGWKGGLVE